jgi:hypothetical protein
MGSLKPKAISTTKAGELRGAKGGRRPMKRLVLHLKHTYGSKDSKAHDEEDSRAAMTLSARDVFPEAVETTRSPDPFRKF